MKGWVFFLLVFVTVVFPCYEVGAQVINTFAGTGVNGYSGDGGMATLAKIKTPSGIHVDNSGNVFIADQNAYTVREVLASTGVIITVAGNGTNGYTGDGGPATAATLSGPTGVTVDSSGNIYIADMYNEVIRKVDPSGVITTIAGNGTIGYSGDGGPATDGKFWAPADVGVDDSGNVFVADQDNNAIRKISYSGLITTLAGGNVAGGYSGDGGAATAAKLNFPEGVGLDSAGNVFVADLYNGRVRRIDVSTGIITTVAGGGAGVETGDGGQATAAGLSEPSSIAWDHLGNMYITDQNTSTLRKVYASGIIETVAGNQVAGYSGDGGPATAAELCFPEGAGVNDSGDVFSADFCNSRVRVITGIPKSAPAVVRGRDTICAGDTAELGDIVNGGVWSSGNTSIVTVGTGTGIVTGIAPGTATIYYTYGFSSSFLIYVQVCPNRVGSTSLTSAVSAEISPNPNNGSFSILLNSPYQENVNVRIENMLGEKVYASVIGTNKPAKLELDVPPGIYVLSVATRGGVLSSKITIGK